jgi:hypothetical protein
MTRSVFAEPRGKATRLASRAFRVVAITLATGEALPTLVRSNDWMPVRVPTRWAVRRRRFECMDSTLANDLRGIAYLYEWAAELLRPTNSQQAGGTREPLFERLPRGSV